MDQNSSETENNFPTNSTMESVENDVMCDRIQSEPLVCEELVSRRVQMFENLKKSSSNISREKIICFPPNVKNDLDEIRKLDALRNNHIDDNLSDFHIGKKPLSQMMTDLMTKDSKRHKNMKNVSKISSVDAALGGMISEIDLCIKRSSEITDRMKKLSIENPVVVQDKIAELKMKLDYVKLKIDEYVANVLNGELKCQIDVASDGYLTKRTSGDSSVVADDKDGETIANSGLDVEPKDGPNSDLKTNSGEIKATLEIVIALNSTTTKNDFSTVETNARHRFEDETVVGTIASKDDDSIAVNTKASCGFKEQVIIDTTVSKDDDSIAVDTKAGCKFEDETVVGTITSKDDDSIAVNTKASCGFKEQVIIDTTVSKDDDSIAVNTKASCIFKEQVIIDTTVSKDDDSIAVDTKASCEFEDETVVGTIASKDYDSIAVNTKASRGFKERITLESEDENSITDARITLESEDEIEVTTGSAEAVNSAVRTNVGNSSSSESEASFDTKKGVTGVYQTKKDKPLSLKLKKFENRKYSLLNRFLPYPIDGKARCIPCDTSFQVSRTTLETHIKSTEHILNLQNYNTKLQQTILKSNSEFLTFLNISEQVLWSDKVFVDPENKIVFCGICGAELCFSGVSIYQHIRGKRHATNKSIYMMTTKKVNANATTLTDCIRLNRIVNVPYGNSILKCLPCGVKLTPDTSDIMSHVESDEHFCKLDEHNLILQREIVRSNPDLFGEGKRYPLSEKHFRKDKLFLNPVSGFMYCGLCRKEVHLKDVKDDILSHLSSENHLYGLLFTSPRNNISTNVSSVDPIVYVESTGTGLSDNDITVKQQPTEKTVEKAHNNLWYAPLTTWVAESDRDIPIAGTSGTTDEDVDSLSERILTDIVQMNNIYGYKIPKHSRKAMQLNGSFKSMSGKKNDPVETRTNKKNVIYNDSKLAKLHRLVPSRNRIKCVSCRIIISSDLEVIHNHIMTEDHRINLCRYNCRAQREIIKKYPQFFGRKKMFHMTDTHIECDMMFVQPDGKFMFCGLCCCELTYSAKNMIEHVAGPSHIKKRFRAFESQRNLECVNNANSIQKDDEHKELLTEEAGNNTDILTATDNKGFKNESENRHFNSVACRLRKASESSAEDSDPSVPCTMVVDDKIVCLLCDVRSIPSQKCLQVHLKSGAHRSNLRALSGPPSVTASENEILERNMIALEFGSIPLVFKCYACLSMCFFDIRTALLHIRTRKHAKTLTKLVEKRNSGAAAQESTGAVHNTNDKHGSFTILKNTSQQSFEVKRECDNRLIPVNQNVWNPTNQLKLTPPQKMPSGNAYALDNKKVKIVEFDDFKKFIRKTENGYMCVECNLHKLSVPMAYAHLRSCGHAPVVVDGVQFLKMAIYHCLVCNVKIYGIKSVVEHISDQRHTIIFAAK